MKDEYPISAKMCSDCDPAGNCKDCALFQLAAERDKALHQRDGFKGNYILARNERNKNQDLLEEWKAAFIEMRKQVRKFREAVRDRVSPCDPDTGFKPGLGDECDGENCGYYNLCQLAKASK